MEKGRAYAESTLGLRELRAYRASDLSRGVWRAAVAGSCVAPDVPLHDVWAVDLPRVREGVTLDEFYRLLSQYRLTGRLPPVARALFGLRFFLGRMFRLEDQPKGAVAASFANGLTCKIRDLGVASGLEFFVSRLVQDQLPIASP